jgi:hypothetical protein
MALIRSGAILAVQLAIGIFGLLLLALTPPARGEMLLVPTTPGAMRVLAPLAVAGPARLIDTGPLPGSLVVFGDRETLLPQMLRHGILVVAAPRAGCGDATPASERWA